MKCKITSVQTYDKLRIIGKLPQKVSEAYCEWLPFAQPLSADNTATCRQFLNKTGKAKKKPAHIKVVITKPKNTPT